MTDGFFSRRASGYEQENAWILSPDFIQPLVPAVFGNGKLLDVCAGTGVIAKHAQQNGWAVSAIDNNADMLAQIPSPICVLVGDAHRLPFADNAFSLVVCRQGVQYLDSEQAIREMLRVSSGQVRLLHGFIAQADIPLWQALFSLVQGPKRNFFSCEMLDSVIRGCACSSVEKSFLKSREHFKKPPEACAAIDEFLQAHPAFVAAYRLDNRSDSFSYDLNWVTHILTK